MLGVPALLKLSASLPDIFRSEGARTQKRIYLDSSVLFHQEEHTPQIHTIQRALWEDRKLRLTYRLAFDAQVEHLEDPHGLVAKANIWHLVCSREGFITVVLLLDVLDTHLSKGKSSMPADFNLVEFWIAWCSRYEKIALISLSRCG